MALEVEPVPTSLSLGGTTKDADNNDNILVGQHCTASMTGLPDDSSWPTKTTYQWSVSGTTFQSWDWVDPPPPDFNSDEGHTNYVDGPGPLTNPTASWYWNDLMGSGASTSETVSCTATVTPPTGSPLTVTAEKKVNVWRPNWRATGEGGIMQVSVPFYANSTDDFWLWAGPLAGSSNGVGMYWEATVSPPSTPSPTLFGAGSIQLVQIITPNLSYTKSVLFGIPYTRNSPENGQEGLDSTCPYGWETVTAPNYSASDSPGLQLLSNTISATVADVFEDYLMYEPPGSGQYVPLAHFNWSTNGNATQPSSGGWAAYSGSAGTVSPSGSAVPFTQYHDFPAWTCVNTAPSF